MSAPGTIVPLGAALGTPIARTSAPEMVVERLLDLVREGRLAPGDRLPSERDLAARLGVSRPTVREALRALSILGILDIRHGGGVTVTSLEAEEMLGPLAVFVSLRGRLGELFDARIHYEPLLARLAATGLSDGELARLDALVREQEAAPGNAELFHDTDAEFHKAILEASGNAFLSRMGRVLQALGEEARRSFQRERTVRERSILDHRAVVRALAARDGDAAHEAMAVHMRNVRAALKEIVNA